MYTMFDPGRLSKKWWFVVFVEEWIDSEKAKSMGRDRAFAAFPQTLFWSPTQVVIRLSGTLTLSAGSKGRLDIHGRTQDAPLPHSVFDRAGKGTWKVRGSSVTDG